MGVRFGDNMSKNTIFQDLYQKVEMTETINRKKSIGNLERMNLRSIKYVLNNILMSKMLVLT